MSDQTPTTEQFKPLTSRERMFVVAYTARWNGTKACREAGYTGNDPTLAVTACRLLRKANVAHAIKQRVSELAMGPDEVLIRLAEIARSSLDDFIDTHGHLDMRAAKENGKLHLVHSYSTSEKYGDKVELYDKLKALEILGKNNGALGELKDALLKNLDLDKLTEHQLRLLAVGNDIITVLLNPTA